MRSVHTISVIAVGLVLVFVWASLDTLRAQPVGAPPPAAGPAAEDGDVAPAPPAPVADDADTEDADIRLVTLIRRGGILMWPIGLCSIIALAFIIERLVRLRRSEVMPAGFLKGLGELIGSRHVDNGRALELCSAHPSPVSRIFRGAFKKMGRTHAEIQKAIEDAGEREVSRMKQNVRTLSTVANIAPLLGLLGTVIGMIRAFAKIRSEAGLGKPEMLAGGIYEALVTTAAGLSVAIPALAMFYFFSHRIDKMVREIDDLAADLVDTLAPLED